MPFNIGIGELVLVAIVALLVFGGRLPEVGRALGKSLVEFKEGLKGAKHVADEEEDEDDEGEGEGEEDPSDAASVEREGERD